jgi:hypothetical protein
MNPPTQNGRSEERPLKPWIRLCCQAATAFRLRHPMKLNGDGIPSSLPAVFTDKFDLISQGVRREAVWAGNQVADVFITFQL